MLYVRIIFLLFFLVTFFLLPSLAIANEASIAAIVLPKLPSNYDASTYASYNRAYIAAYDYLVSSYDHRKKVFRWQLISSMIIFVIVVMLVIIGVYFSWQQFKKALAEGKSMENTELKASLTGIQVSSSVLGIIILVIALLFFYLYLVYVYPISVIS